MAITPVEIRHISLGRGLLGYLRGPTDRLLDEVAASFEEVWRERADLADKVEQLEADLERFRELEALLRTTLVSAERTAAELKAQATRESDLIVEEARAEARSIIRQAATDNERLEADSARIRALLRAALSTIEAARPDEDDEDEDEAQETHPEAA
jgi:cell division initiation protein